MLAATPGELDSLKLICSRARYLGMETEMITIEEAKRLNPLIDPQYFIGALWRADGGHCDPSGTTHAYVKAARTLGAEVERFTRVERLDARADGSWTVVTNKGEIHAEHVVNCGGLWAREVGRMVGIELPVLAMEHMYLVTEDMPEVAAFNKEKGHELPHAIDFKSEIYMRQEHSGMVLGTYERACVPWSPKNTPWAFGGPQP
jgi:dimethylglycine dehydrogenase